MDEKNEKTGIGKAADLGVEELVINKGIGFLSGFAVIVFMVIALICLEMSLSMGNIFYVIAFIAFFIMLSIAMFFRNTQSLTLKIIEIVCSIICVIAGLTVVF